MDENEQAMLRQYGKAFEAYRQIFRDASDAVDSFEDAFIGEYPSHAAFKKDYQGADPVIFRPGAGCVYYYRKFF